MVLVDEVLDITHASFTNVILERNLNFSKISYYHIEMRIGRYNSILGQ